MINNESTTTVMDDQVQAVNLNQVEYSKFNPKLSPKLTYLPFLSNKWWNVYKYGLAILLAVFCILSLYFTSVWQARPNGADTNGAQLYLGTLEQLKMISGGKWNFANLVNYVDSDGEINVSLNNLNDLLNQPALAGALLSKSLFDLVSFFTNGALSALMAFSIIGIIWIFPLLIFRSQTRCSSGAMIGGLVLATIVIALFSTGMNAQNTLLMPFKDVQATINQINSYANAVPTSATGNPIGVNPYMDKISELKIHLIDAITKFGILFSN